MYEQKKSKDNSGRSYHLGENLSDAEDASMVVRCGAIGDRPGSSHGRGDRIQVVSLKRELQGLRFGVLATSRKH